MLGAPVYDEYRSAETPWMAGECRMRTGLHIFADAKRIEVVDPYGRSLPAGEVGDIVVTDLANRVFPIIRYRHGDRGSLIDGTCDAGCRFPAWRNQTEGPPTSCGCPAARRVSHITVMFAKHPESVRLFQIRQNADYSIAVRVVLGR